MDPSLIPEKIYAEEFEDYEEWDLYKDDERVWCGKTDTIAELCDVCFENPVLGKKVRDYYSCVFVWGSDPLYVEDTEQAISIFLQSNEDGVEVTLLEGDELEDAWAQLNMVDEHPSVVYSFGKYNQEKWIISFEGDNV